MLGFMGFQSAEGVFVHFSGACGQGFTLLFGFKSRIYGYRANFVMGFGALTGLQKSCS